MEYLIIICICVICCIISYFIVNFKISYYKRIICNAMILLTFKIILFLKEYREFEVACFNFLVIWSICGVIIHYIMIPLENIISKFFCKLEERPYKKKTYEEILHSHHDELYHCVLLFTDIKLLFYILIIASLVDMI